MDERGASLVGLLATLLVLAAIAFLVLKFTTSQKVLSAAKSAPTAAAESVCAAEVNAIDQAVQAYTQLNGHAPPAGDAWAVTTADGGPWIQSWPGVAQEYTLTWTGHQLVVSTPRGAGCAHA